MQTFESVSAVLVGRCKDRRKVANNTYLERRDDGAIALKLHATDVVTYYPDRFVLDTGGWRTVTTKDRMKHAGVRVYSDKGTWYVHAFDGGSDWEHDIRYFDGIAFDYQGKCLNAELAPVDTSRVTAKTKREIATYAKLAIEKLNEGLPLPSGADCWYCAMQTTDGQSLGDAHGDTEHLRSHIAEGYIVPSLLWQAVSEAGYRFPAIILGVHEGGLGGMSAGDHPRPRAIGDSVRRALAKYLKRRLLPSEEGSKPVGTPAHTGGFAVAR